MPTNAKSTPIYSNILQIAANGQKLAVIDISKAEWYVEKSLGRLELKEENGYSGILYLNFNPKKIRQKIKNEDLRPLMNQCVVCGTNQKDNLNSHHVVPKVIRAHYPYRHKEHQNQWVVGICIPCHKNIENVYKKESYHVYLNKVEKFLGKLRNLLIKLWIWRRGGPKKVNLIFRELFLKSEPKYLPKHFLENR